MRVLRIGCNLKQVKIPFESKVCWLKITLCIHLNGTCKFYRPLTAFDIPRQIVPFHMHCHISPIKLPQSCSLPEMATHFICSASLCMGVWWRREFYPTCDVIHCMPEMLIYRGGGGGGIVCSCKCKTLVWKIILYAKWEFAYHALHPRPPGYFLFTLALQLTYCSS
jgi:hypothetical protein